MEKGNTSATYMLPPNYRPLGTVDLPQDKRLTIVLTMAGALLLVLCLWVVTQLALVLRPDAWGEIALNVTQWSEDGFEFYIPVGWIVSFALAQFIVVVIHEAVHGLFFWLFTREKPRYGFTGLFAYAAPPEGLYVVRNPYLVTTLAPLVVLSLLGIALMLVSPPILMPFLICFVSVNAGGAVGDLFVAGWLLRHTPDILATDRGTAMTLYGPAG